MGMARALLQGAGDRQRSDAARYVLQSEKIIKGLERMAEDNAIEAERATWRDDGDSLRRFTSAVASRCRRDALYHTATVLRVMRGADTASMDAGIDFEERCWRHYAVTFLVRTLWGNTLCERPNVMFLLGLSRSAMDTYATNASAWTQLMTDPRLRAYLPEQSVSRAFLETDDLENGFSAAVSDVGGYKGDSEQLRNSIRAEVRAAIRVDGDSGVSVPVNRRRAYNHAQHALEQSKIWNDWRYEARERERREAKFEPAARQALPQHATVRDHHRRK